MNGLTHRKEEKTHPIRAVKKGFVNGVDLSFIFRNGVKSWRGRNETESIHAGITM